MRGNELLSLVLTVLRLVEQRARDVCVPIGMPAHSERRRWPQRLPRGRSEAKQAYNLFDTFHPSARRGNRADFLNLCPALLAKETATLFGQWAATVSLRLELWFSRDPKPPISKPQTIHPACREWRRFVNGYCSFLRVRIAAECTPPALMACTRQPSTWRAVISTGTAFPPSSSWPTNGAGGQPSDVGAWTRRLRRHAADQMFYLEVVNYSIIVTPLLELPAHRFLLHAEAAIALPTEPEHSPGRRHHQRVAPAESHHARGVRRPDGRAAPFQRRLRRRRR